MKLLHLSRPFDFISTQGTGEQVVAREIFNAINSTTSIDIIRLKRLVLKPYGKVSSLIFYDFIMCLIYSLASPILGVKKVYINSPYQSIGVLIFKLFRIKSYLLIHDLFFLEEPNTFFNKLSAVMYRYGIKYSSSIITTTEENQKLIFDHYGVNSKVIYLGITNSLNSVYSKRKDLEKLNDITIGYIGSYVKRKRTNRIAQLINITSSLKVRNLNYLFAGSVSDEFIQSIKSFESSVSIKILGNISEASKPNFYSKIDYLFFPTKLEGFGLPIIEAMRSGVIPVVLKDSIIPSAVKSKCIITESPDEFAIMLEDIIKNNKVSEYNEIKENNYRYSLETFTYSKYSEYILS